ncbi:MAG: hypothetical protein QM689_11100 [Oscillospiraceae bacterium]
MKKKLFALTAAATIAFSAAASTFTVFTASAVDETDAVVTAAADQTSFKAQMVIQTNTWTYRNPMQDTTYGKAGEGDWEGKLIAWNKSNKAYDYGTPNGISFTDCVITGNGTYSVKLEGDLTANCTGFNILGVSTNLPREATNDDELGLADQPIVVSGVKVYIDGKKATIPGKGAAIIDPDTNDFLNIQVANQWNDALGKTTFAPVNTTSIEIKFTISGFENYPDSLKAKLSTCKTELSTTAYTYTGSAKKPEVTLTHGSKTLVKNTDYTVSYKNNTKVGKATVTIKGKGNFTGTITKFFKINPKAPTLSSVTAGTKKATVKFTKVSGASGYEIYRTAAKGGKYTKVKTTTSTSFTNTSLTKGKTYYYKVRTYQTVSGVKYYSKFSSVKYTKAK